uniref:Prefoldin subunit 4 n=1 Tax=Leptobrachium leishanense TaxID=445787 RepID=A0A8C5QX92_9ANUR
MKRSALPTCPLFAGCVALGSPAMEQDSIRNRSRIEACRRYLIGFASRKNDKSNTNLSGLFKESRIGYQDAPNSDFPRMKQLQNLEDACEDLMMLDDGLLVPYQIGDVFISHSQEEAQEMLENAKRVLEEDMEGLESRVASILQVLAGLKVQLYAKFGNNINLEAEDS